MSKQEMPESGGCKYLNPMEKKELLEGAWEVNGSIEERLLSARNDSLSGVAGKTKRPGGEPGLLSLAPNWEVVPNWELVVAAAVTAASTV
jgi:hypothetical protein